MLSICDIELKSGNHLRHPQIGFYLPFPNEATATKQDRAEPQVILSPSGN